MLLAAVFALSACGNSAIRAGCSQAADCGQLAATLTEDECVATWSAKVTSLRESNLDSCTKYADAIEALFSCRSALGCDDTSDLMASSCAEQQVDFNVRATVASGECR